MLPPDTDLRTCARPTTCQHQPPALASYRAHYGLSPCTTANGCFAKLNQSGTASPLPSPNSGWAGEIALDLDMVSATCPNCDITLIEATDASDNIFAAVAEAVHLGAKYVSMSWGGPEDGSEAYYDQRYFAWPGVLFAAATGDSAYASGALHPATSPAVLAVGGTTRLSTTSARAACRFTATSNVLRGSRITSDLGSGHITSRTAGRDATRAPS